jgi:aminopeptidase N
VSHDSDGFNRWEAGQRLAVDVIQEVIQQIQQGAKIAVDKRLVDACENNLNQAIAHDRDGSVDKAMIANMLVMPSETYLGELADIADVDSIHQAREAVRVEIATNLKGLLLSVYKLNQDSGEYQFNADAIARRALKNVALAYLMVPEDTEMVSLCADQFEDANNMTDTSAAFRALVNSDAGDAQGAREKALIEFFNRWSDEALVIDQWFAIQAASPRDGALDRVRALMRHPAFDMKNPNRMRSVVVSFAFQNNVHFHNRSGAGYAFLADCVIELNAFNPQMAARILAPLTQWRKYEGDRQQLMKTELNRILDTENLSENVFEIASKSV